MQLTSQMIKDKAKALGIDDLAIGNIERFDKAPALLSVKNYFPGCKSVIALLMRIPRGSYRGIEEGTHWHNYTFYSYNRLNTVIRPRLTYALSCFIEDHGWEAVPHYPAVPERNPTRPPVGPGRYPPDIVPSTRMVAAGTGLGEVGHAKVFLNKKFGPRLRLGLIFTDAVLEPDPILETGTICMQCGACVRECPGNAVPPVKDKSKWLEIDYGEKKIHYGDVHMGRCVLTHHGQNNTISPFHKKALPNMAFDAANSDMTEEEAYRICYPLAQATWSSYSENKDNAVIEYYHYIMAHVDYFAICGARGCIRACMNALEKAGRIENTFKEPFYRKKSWLMKYTPDPDKIDKGVNQFRETYLEKHYPGVTAGEYGMPEKPCSSTEGSHLDGL
ncbi:(4Fe-4S)-binding protein [Spirochaetia bacterium]|nr:(4Fe-4S)-binding protein [Spirochaetia bacterium]